MLFKCDFCRDTEIDPATTPVMGVPCPKCKAKPITKEFLDELYVKLEKKSKELQNPKCKSEECDSLIEPIHLKLEEEFETIFPTEPPKECKED